MKLFIWALCITSFLQFFTARYAKDFNGASVGMFNYLNFMVCWFYNLWSSDMVMLFNNMVGSNCRFWSYICR